MWNNVAQRCVRADVVLGRYEPWTANASLHGCIHGVPKTTSASDAPDARRLYNKIPYPQITRIELRTEKTNHSTFNGISNSYKCDIFQAQCIFGLSHFFWVLVL